MSVRFILGRAGTGKTHHCLQQLRAHLAEDPVEGPALLLLVPEQASMQMEREILAKPGPGASHRAEVLSFRRLSFRVLSAVGGSSSPPQRALTELGRDMVVQHLLTTLTAELRYYRRRDHQVGLVRKLSTCIAELIGEAIEPSALLEAAQQTTEEGQDPLRARRLWDLGTIYQAYLNYLGDTRVDPTQYLQLARERLDCWPQLAGAHVWMDGFAWMTRQERMTVVALARLAARVDITVMIDPSDGHRETPAGHSLSSAPPSLFSMTHQLYSDLHHSLSTAAIDFESPILLPETGTGTAPRFRRAAELAHVEQTLFQARSVDRPSTGDKSIELVEAPDRRVEIDFAVASICRWTQRPEHPLRYREMAIIVADLEPYHDLLAAALADRDIPFFIDRRRPMGHHPLVELLRGVIELSLSDFSIDSARLLLKTGLLGVDDSDAHALENYLLATGLRGAAMWQDPNWPATSSSRPDAAPDSDTSTPWDVEVMVEVRRARDGFCASVEPFYSKASGEESVGGAVWAYRLAQWLDHLEVRSRLDGWAREAQDDGDLDQAAQHRQIWRDVTALLRDLAETFGDRPLTLRGLGEILDAGLSQLTLGLAPPMLDQVLVGTIDRSRHPDLRGVIILGFSEGMFPAVHAEDAVLTDNDRDTLAGPGGDRVGRTRVQKILDERLLFYVAMTRASEHVILTYPAVADDGKSLGASPYVSDLMASCPGLEVRRIEDPQWGRQTWGLLRSSDVAGYLTAELGSRQPLADDRTSERARANRLYESLRIRNDLQRTLSRSLAALTFSNDAHVTQENAGKLLDTPFHGSVSGLETQAACPFKYFSKYSLRLRKREVASLEAVDVGRVHHAVLDDFVSTLLSEKRSLGDLLDSTVMDRLLESCRRVAIRPPPGAALSTAREAYILRRGEEELERVVQVQRRVAAAGEFRPRAAEVRFGFSSKGSLAAVVITTPRGRRIYLRGVIDRVDLAEVADEMLGVVIDYKSKADPTLDFSQVYYGLSLQLLGYLLVLAEQGETLADRPIRPVGAFYVSLRERYDLLVHPSQCDLEPTIAKSAYRPRGLMDIDRIDSLDGDYSGHGRSDVYNVYRKKDGQLGYVDISDGADANVFADVLDHARWKLGELADGVMDGNVAVEPYRLAGLSPCTWCSFRAVCRFEVGQSSLRYLDSMKRSTVFDAIRSQQVERGGRNRHG